MNRTNAFLVPMVLGALIFIGTCACARSGVKAAKTEREIADQVEVDSRLLTGRDLLQVYRTSSNFDERYWSIWYLGEKGSADEMIGLIAAAADESVMEPVVAMALQKANFRLNSKPLRLASIAYAEGLLDGRHRSAVEQEAMILLVKLNSKGSIPVIYKLLDRRPKWSIRRQALETIGQLNFEEGKEAARLELLRMSEEREEVERLLG